jgi:hypothetical protein
MPNQVQVMIDQDIYERLQMLMVPPVSDINSAIKALLYHDGRASPAAIALGAAGQHFTYAEEMERTLMGIYDGGGGT